MKLIKWLIAFYLMLFISPVWGDDSLSLPQESTSIQAQDYIQQQLSINSELKEILRTETNKNNALNQNEMRMTDLLDTLKQTQRTIDEQISALQGTLLLSRIIQQQKQNLPTNLNITHLSTQISELRVSLFNYTQQRNELYDLDKYLMQEQESQQQLLSNNEKQQLITLLTERRNLLSDLINALNLQLNLAMSLEQSQQQIIQLSNQIQAKLDQQSFWEKSNEPFSLSWLQHLPQALEQQIITAYKKLDFSLTKNSSSYFSWLVTALVILLLIGFLIVKFNNYIKQRLVIIDSKINHLHTDSQWHTPTALLLTALLVLPSVLWFLLICLLIGYFCFYNPVEFWHWALEMAGYWWFFAFLLALLRQNGIMIRHFGIAQNRVGDSREFTQRVIIAVALQLNTSVFSAVAENGLVSDVLGQIITVTALIICFFIIAPLFNQNIKKYQLATEIEQPKQRLKFMRILLYILPAGLIILVGLGYYYTALVLIQHLIISYLAWTVWSLARQCVYRAITVSAYRLAQRRLIEKTKQYKNEMNSDNGLEISEEDKRLALNEVRNQLIGFTDLFLWLALLLIFYCCWFDLVTVVSYLQNITLWTHTTTTEAGVITETVTLFSLVVALVILSITYMLIRNIAGILEILIFSRFQLSQGTPYAITTLLTYLLIAIGAGWAFATLGISWSKLQWLFAALSVGLGFGMQEIFANFVSGIILLFERPIRVGDTVTINGISGTVSKIRIRAISIIDSDRKEVIVPNKSFVTGQITNWALSNTITRLVIQVGVAYGSDLELVKKLLLQAAAETPNVLKQPRPRAFFLSFGASTLDHELRVYVNDVDIRTETIDLLNRKINALFNANNIDIAFNQLDIFIKNKDNGEIMPLIDIANLNKDSK